MISWMLAALAAAQPVPGTYLLELDVATEARVPVIGWTPILTRSVVLAELERAGDDWTITQRVCDVRVIGGRPAITTMPPALIAGIPVQRYPLRVTEAPGGWSIEADPGPTRLGEDPTGAPVDVDHDGRPGATVWLDVPVLGRVEVYVAQVGHTRWAGGWSGDRASGRTEVLTLAQRTLGASHTMFAGERPTRVVPERSVFRLVPLSPGADCGGAAAASTPSD